MYANIKPRRAHLRTADDYNTSSFVSFVCSRRRFIRIYVSGLITALLEKYTVYYFFQVYL